MKLQIRCKGTFFLPFGKVNSVKIAHFTLKRAHLRQFVHLFCAKVVMCVMCHECLKGFCRSLTVLSAFYQKMCTLFLLPRNFLSKNGSSLHYLTYHTYFQVIK